MSISSKQKVYQAILQEIQKYIEENRLQAGDKLPSERELAEKLNAGRSSVREALRALELLGLIETRHGEGTYLRTYRPYQTVEILSSFILQNNTKKDLFFTKKILEKEAAKLAFSRLNEADITNLENIIKDADKTEKEKHYAFFDLLFEKTENLLLIKMWKLMVEFSNAIRDIHYMDPFYHDLIHLFKIKDYGMIEQLFGEQKVKSRI